MCGGFERKQMKLALILCLLPAFAQQPKTPPASVASATPAADAPAPPKATPVDLAKLDAEDLKVLEFYQGELDKLTPQVEPAKVQLMQAQLLLQRYDATQTSRLAIFYKICAKLKLDADEYEFTPDGKGIQKKPPAKVGGKE
jgi:hypothetical protein